MIACLSNFEKYFIQHLNLDAYGRELVAMVLASLARARHAKRELSPFTVKYKRLR